MRIRPSYYPWLFLLTLLLVSVPSLMSAVMLKPLYLEPDLRDRTQKSIQQFADERGLLLSNISITHVDTKSVVIEVREYKRGKDPVSCFEINFVADTTPCKNASSSK